MIVGFGAVDVDGMDPRRDVGVLAADQQMPPTTRATLLRGFAFVTNQNRGRCFVVHRSIIGVTA